MAGKQSVPYGAWSSPVTIELVVGRTMRLSGPVADGSDLLWLESRASEGGRLTLMRRREGAVSEVTPAPFNVGTRVHEYGGGAVATQAGLVVFSDRRDGVVRVVDSDGAMRVIAGVAGCRYADFRFVPGRRAVVCVREDHRDRPPNDPEAAIVLLDLDGDPAQGGLVLVRGPDFLAAPSVSPAGDRLAWIAWNHPDMPWDATTLQVAPLDRDAIGTARRVAGATAEAVLCPTWSPAGELHFCSDRSGWWNIYRETNGATEAVTSLEAEIGGPHWVFGSRYFTFLPDGRILAAITREGRSEAALIADGAVETLPLGPVQGCPAVLASPPGTLRLAAGLLAPDAPPSIVAVERDAAGAWSREVLRTAGPAVLTAADISLGEAFTFATGPQGADGEGGEQAHAIWYPPLNARFEGPADEKPPLVVMIHGGPTAMTSNAFSLGVQWWTSRGFGVVDVNYRGSTGFGRAYRQKLDGQWGIADVEDCIAAAAHLVRAGKVDGKRLAIRGGSAGGFTALAVLTTSPDFAAGASLYGVADLSLLAADTHKFESRYLDRLIGPLPAAAALYAERSPVNHLDRLNCGVIFFQGLDDKVVPPNQARVMVDAMRARGLPVAHVEFPGEDHGFRQAETLKRVLELELDFYGRLFGFVAPGLSERVSLLA